MMISIDNMRQRLESRFSDVEQIDANVIRFVRKASDSPFAVYYIDLSSQLPPTSAALDEYQDRIVGKFFFQGRKSLQWSNYLFFVVESPVSIDARIVIEGNRRYARKFIVTEPELESALTPPAFQIAEGAVDASVISSWTTLLGAANLDRAVLNDENMPRRLELIEAAFGQDALPAPTVSSPASRPRLPFLKTLELTRFRPHPAQRSFEFGLVTMICGPNGAGKTSLMEAIELTYCGRNYRNPDSDEKYLIKAGFDDGKSERVENGQPASKYRDRNLAWYGQAETRTNNLFQSFSRFNFLNTDAAVGLAESKHDLDEDLSKLLVGPEASKSWREIVKTSEKLAEKIKELQAVKAQADSKRVSIEGMLKAATDEGGESGTLLKSLRQSLSTLKWDRHATDGALWIPPLVESMADLEALIDQVLGFDWNVSPISVYAMREFLQAGKKRIAAAEKVRLELAESMRTERRLKDSLSQAERAINDLEELDRFYSAKVPAITKEVEALTRAISEATQAVSGKPTLSLPETIRGEEEAPIVNLLTTRRGEFAAATDLVQQAQERYTAFTVRLQESLKLAQQLRDIATRLIQMSKEVDVCPLCHTPFPAGELEPHIMQGVQPGLEAEAESLLSELRAREIDEEAKRRLLESAVWLSDVCERLSIPSTEACTLAVNRVKATVEQLETDEKRLAFCKGELSKCETAGLGPQRLQELLTRQAGEFDVEGGNETERLASLIVEAGKRRDVCQNELGDIRKSIDAAKNTLGILLEAPGDEVDQLVQRLASIKERYARAIAIMDRFESLYALFPWDPNSPLSEIAVEIGAIRKRASAYQVAIANETNAIKVVAEAKKQNEQIDKQLSALVPRIDRLREAQSVLVKIQNEYSLTSAMDEALRQNRTAIEGIFARIHSPAEFAGLGSTLRVLVRKAGGENASLQQISTGQRAAFALSLFLAQNAQLKSAPPLILIDDPIAYVDDLNCLSFLDYLREVVIRRERQIVFATANEKLAVLFERKFDFLGAVDFRRYDLKR